VLESSAPSSHAVDHRMRSIELLIFGNPTAGMSLVPAAQTSGIDLPLTVLVWEYATGGVWIA
jgi:uncharacterized protein (DUF302 family)